ncbi:LysR family transcriptional regulator [Azospirillum sp. ST 5-10]|uniref:LysR family transcriptional regulator n=1 Tax=unclassified Azospirillum TaxID=2630922 RepID=UPI003F4A0624
MDIRQLRYFVAVVEAASFTRAAERLGVTQPALGQQIRALEEQLDVALIVRHSRGVTPTEAGRALAEEARNILAGVEAATARVKGFADQPQGTVTLGLTPNTSSRLAGPLLRKAAAEAPKIRLSLVEEMSAVLMDWVAAGELSMALAYSATALPGLRWEPVLEEALFFVESAARGKRDGGTIPFAAVASHALVVPGTKHSTRRVLDATAAAAGIALDIVHEVQSVALMRDLVAQGMAATVMPLGSVRKEVAAGELIAKRIVEPEIRRDLFLVQSDRRPLTRAEQALKQMLRPLVQAEIERSDGVWSPVARRRDAVARIGRFRARGPA